ncbi:hypothetical protein [Ornithinibacillus sp. JPR2-1]|uniref:hypothetical protein n=1 Tax=Ornithinibacillus sp. JPR2-1 TaxID=2094019 RepID=UPI0031DA50DE
MPNMNNSGKGYKENDIEEYQFNNYLFIITRFKRVNWMEYEGVNQYKYFIYIFDSRLVRGENFFENLLLNISYPTFEILKSNLKVILSEYILERQEVVACIEKIERLNPLHKY